MIKLKYEPLSDEQISQVKSAFAKAKQSGWKLITLPMRGFSLPLAFRLGVEVLAAGGLILLVVLLITALFSVCR